MLADQQIQALRALVLRLTYVVLLWILSTMVVGSFLRDRIDGLRHVSFAAQVDGTAYRPYVYRMLAPKIIYQVRECIPDETQAWITENAWNNQLYRNTAERLKWSRENTTGYLVASGLFLLSFLGFAAVFRRMLLRIGRLGETYSRAWTLVAIAGLPVMFKYYSYLYDPTQVFVFTAGLLLLAQRRWSLYLPWLVLATFSKETSILLIFLFAIHYLRDLDRKTYLGLLALQSALFLGAKFWISARFADNPGGLIEFHLVRNLFLTSYEIADFVALVVVGAVIARGWHRQPQFLRDGLWILVPLLVLTLFLGFLDEYRDYYEAYPIVLALLGVSISNALRDAKDEPGTVASQSP